MDEVTSVEGALLLQAGKNMLTLLNIGHARSTLTPSPDSFSDLAVLDAS